MPDKSGQPLEKALQSIRVAREQWAPDIALVEQGMVKTVLNGIVKIDGLPGVGNEELVMFHDNLFGIALNIDPGEVGIVLLGDYSRLSTGDRAWRTGRVADVPVGPELIGRVIDPLGRPLDEFGPLGTTLRLPVERPAPPIMDRAPVTVPLQTGIKVIDALVPVGRGQRELILGDRQTGKTSLALSAMINQHDKTVICIYCAIGQKAASVAKVVSVLREHGTINHSVVMVSEGNDPPGLQYIAPYAATSIAEYFMQQGRDVLVVYDDLTNHARAYRELSLLLRRPPGREAFPGDIFYIHSRLLERATHLVPELGGGSLTALPIIETEAQNIAAYIPTNLISITDGQIYLSPTLFELGILPALDIGKSVSRVGGKAQLDAYRAVTGSLKLAWAQFEELEIFARFGTRLDEASRKIIEHGQRIRECFKQDEFDVLALHEQILILLALTSESFAPVSLDQMRKALALVRKAAKALPEDLVARILSGKSLNERDRSIMLDVANKALEPFGKPHE